MSLAVMRLHSRDEFQSWLAQDLDVREEFYAEIQDDLDIDVASLDRLEAWLLEHYAKPDDILSLRERAMADGAARHLGLVLALNVADAVWQIDLDREDNAFYRLPIVRMADGLAVCPLALVTASLVRRTGHFLRQRAEALAASYNDEDEDAGQG